jgi:pimeloyl-ACP methyl ester carboxylesterase
LLAALDAEQPTVGWGRFLVDDRPDWPSIVVVGWSDGGSMAAITARDLPIHAAVLISAPAADADGSVLVPWMEEPFVTPGDRIWGVRHVEEASALFMDAAWERWALPGPNVLFDEVPAPFASHRLTSDLAPIGEDCSAHNTVASDQCMDPKHAELYVPLMCQIGAL